MKRIILTTVLTLILSQLSAQVTVPTAAGDLKLRFMGRTNFDAGFFPGLEGTDDNGVVMNDTRLGVQASFDEKWSAKIEICYQQKAVSFRDLWIGYDFSEKSSLKAGNFFMPFGSKILGLAYKFVEDAPLDYTFCPSRKMGLAYSYTSDPLNLTFGIFSDGDVDAKALNRGYNLSAKAVVRPICDEESILHIGLAPLFTHSPNAVTIKSTMPVTFANPNVTLISSGALDAISQVRLEAELIYIMRRFLFETHYMMTSVNMPGEDNYTANGIFAQASFQLIGKQQKYNKKGGITASSPAKTLELLARVDYMNLDGGDFHPEGDGKETDITIGVNYFFNKYVNAKLNYVHAKVKDAEDSLNAMQLRLQFSF